MRRNITGRDMQFMLKSSKSTRVSLDAIRNGKAGLTPKRDALLRKVPNQNDWNTFAKGKIRIIDLAYLTAKTGDEFALLEGKKEDVLFHGQKWQCCFSGMLEELLMEGKLQVTAHSHPGEDIPLPSAEDRAMLRKLNQKSSSIISATTGKIIEFISSMFEEL